MIRRVDLRGTAAASPDYRTLVPRAEFDVDAAVDVVRPICEEVRERGVPAVLEFSAQFDAVDQTDIAVPAEPLPPAPDALVPAGRAGPDEPIPRLRTTHLGELEADVVTDLGP